MTSLINEANRCLSCKNAKCAKHCPINTDIPTIINLYKNNQLKEAGQLLFDNNPLSSICSIVCPHEDQCLGNCIKGIKDTPVEFYKIEEEISTEFLKTHKIDIPNRNGKKVAIIGSGPAGLSVATQLVKKGYDITIFDKNEEPGGMLRYGIPEFRLSRLILDNIIRILKDAGVKFKLNSLVGPIITIDKLFEDGYDSIFIGTGVWNPRRLDIKGETLSNAHYAIDYLKSPTKYDLGDNVVVIGAGNVAMDAARTAKFYGAKKVSIIYRRGFEDMPATKVEIEHAEKENVEFLLYKAPMEITEEGVIFADTKSITLDNGKKSLVIDEDNRELFECSSILIAVSQVPRNAIHINNTSIKVNDRGLIIVDDEGHTSREGVFASGDVAYGAETVVKAVANSKFVANSIDSYLQSL